MQIPPVQTCDPQSLGIVHALPSAQPGAHAAPPSQRPLTQSPDAQSEASPHT
jgi:hypothetical protein